MQEKKIISEKKFWRIARKYSPTVCYVKFPKTISFVDDSFYEIVTGYYHNGYVAVIDEDVNGNHIYVNKRVYGFLKEEQYD